MPEEIAPVLESVVGLLVIAAYLGLIFWASRWS